MLPALNMASALFADRNRYQHKNTRRKGARNDERNILSRRMADLVEPNDWQRSLGTDRRRIGDFAGRVHCILGLRAR